MDPRGAGWGAPCPVCARPTGDLGPASCPRCGLPAAARSAHVVARIGATLAELTRDRDDLLTTLRAAAPGAVRAGVTTAPTPAWAPPPPRAPVPAPPPTPVSSPIWPATPPPVPWPPAPGTLPPPAPAAPRRRLSPQQVLVGLGALLVVAAALAFVAVAWTRLGLAFQAGAMLVVTGALCSASAWTARRGLRATEEALAAAGAALLVVDLAAARWLGLGGLEEVPLRPWWAVCCAVVVTVALILGRLTRSTVTWPLVALLAAQPLPFLILTGDLFTGSAGVAVALSVAAADVVVAERIRPTLRPLATVLAGAFAAAGAVGGLVVAADPDAVESWTATGVLSVAGTAALALASRRPGARLRAAVPGGVGAVVGAAVALSLGTTGPPGWWLAAGLGVLLLCAAALTAPRTGPTAGFLAAGAALVAVPALDLAVQRQPGELAAISLAVAVPAVLAAARIPGVRPSATGVALATPLLALLLAREDGLLSTPTTGLLLAVLAALSFGLATARAGRGEEWVAAACGAAAGAAAGIVGADVGAWGQVGLQLGIAGVAAGCYAVVAGRRWVGAVAVADLVVATWIAVAGAGIGTPEAYTLPAAAGLLVMAVPGLRRGARSWAAEGAAIGMALVPSALVVVASPSALRLVLVVAAAAAIVVAGVLLHRQAPFLLGAGVLLVVSIGRLAPYTPLLPRWLTLGTAGLLLLVVGATYEHRRQQAREAVAWVGQMR